MSNPITALHEALSAAVHRDLPECVYSERDWVKWHKMSQEERTEALKNRTVPTTTHTRRPYTDEVNVTMFSQGWGSTALGYDGIGGQALTDAYTVVVDFLAVYCVYFGCGRLAYKIDARQLTKESCEKFHDDLTTRNMPGQHEMAKRYKFK
jgi:hypothetical protein